MRHVAIPLALIALCGGCGTYANFRGEVVPPPGGLGIPGTPPRTVYGGVMYDAMYGTGLFKRKYERIGAIPAGLYVLAVDLPLSAVGDTLTLPWTVHATCDRIVDEHGYPPPDDWHEDLHSNAD